MMYIKYVKQFYSLKFMVLGFNLQDTPEKGHLYACKNFEKSLNNRLEQPR